MARDGQATGEGQGNRWRLALWGGAAALLALPALAMCFTTEVAWGAGDFLVFGALLLGACGACELLVRRISGRAGRIVAVALMGLAFLWAWAELAVGVFSDLGS